MSLFFIMTVLFSSVVFADGPGLNKNSKYYGLSSTDGVIEMSDLRNFTKDHDGGFLSAIAGLGETADKVSQEIKTATDEISHLYNAVMNITNVDGQVVLDMHDLELIFPQRP